MARLTDEQSEKLAIALGAGAHVVQASSGAVGAPEALRGAETLGASRTGQDVVRQLQEFVRDPGALDALGRALTIDLASYLNRPVRCSFSQTLAPVGDPWRFESDNAGYSWWIEFDAGLGAAFADAMIGGDGTATFGRGRRARGLVKHVATRMLQCIAVAAGLEPPAATTLSAAAHAGEAALAGGNCAVASHQHAWQVGAFAKKVAQSSEAAVPMPTAQTRTIADTQQFIPTALEDPGSIIVSIVSRLCSHLQEALRCEVSAQSPLITDLADAELTELPPAALQLGLTAGGNGALVASLDRDAVAGLAAGVGAAGMPPTQSPGDVVVAAAEAIVRDALREIASRLPGVNGEAHRIVRLADNSLPARTPHHAASVRLNICGRLGALYLLVPSWMLVPPSGASSRSDEARRT